MPAFTTDYPILFRHCDPFGIVFYPRYVEMINDVVERWFGEALGVPFDVLHMERGLGIPTVRLEIDFRKPTKLGEVLEISLSVRELRTRAFSIRLEFRKGDEVRMESHSTLVMAEMKSGRSTVIPDDIRAGMEKFLEVGDRSGSAATPDREPRRKTIGES